MTDDQKIDCALQLILNSKVQLYIGFYEEQLLNKLPPVSLVEVSQKVFFTWMNFPYHSAKELTETFFRLIFLSTGRKGELKYINLDLDNQESLYIASDSLSLEVCEIKNEKKKWGSVDILRENEQAGLYILNIAPRGSIPAHYHANTDEVEMVLSEGLECNGTLLPWGRVLRWESHVHEYWNLSSEIKSVLCVDKPKFDPSDEIEVSTKNYALPINLNHGTYISTIGHPFGLSNARFRFPGAYPSQEIQYVANCESAREEFNEPCQFVLVLAFDKLKQLLLVHHKERGWEVPGGKVEEGETQESAVIREVYEESGIKVDQLQVIGQYAWESKKYKRVFVARFDQLPLSKAEWNQMETDDRRVVSVRYMRNLINEQDNGGYSPLMLDQAFPISLALALEYLQK